MIIYQEQYLSSDQICFFFKEIEDNYCYLLYIIHILNSNFVMKIYNGKNGHEGQS